MTKVFRSGPTYLTAAIGAFVLLACSPSDLVNTDAPTGFGSIADPEAMKNETGALDTYKGAINKFREATTGGNTSASSYVVISGMLGDELNAGLTNTATFGAFTRATAVDGRSMTATDIGSIAGGYDNAWRELHGVRIQAMNAMGALRKYAPKAPKDYVGHLFALWGMSEVMLANFFCSGIPLSTVQFEGSFSYVAGSTSQEVYEHAIAMFDSAVANAPDSVEIRNLAAVGKGWALLSLGRFAEAAEAVAGVPDGFVYRNLHSTASANSVGTPNFTFSTSAPTPGVMGTVSDREGTNGLPYRSSNDPRTRSPEAKPPAPLSGELAVFIPERWNKPKGGNTSIIVASGVEARLIQAEAALKTNDPSWLAILNRLRTDGTTAGDGSYNPGSGAILFTSVGGTLPGLAPLSDPGTPTASIDMLFTERAYWLFMTGHRMPDMRRLVRQYGRSQDQVFPIGPYPAGPLGGYGSDVNAPAPPLEAAYNPEYSGCFDRQP